MLLAQSLITLIPTMWKPIDAGSLAEAAERITENNWAQDIYQIGPALSFRPTMNAGNLVEQCFANQVLILGGGAMTESGVFGGLKVGGVFG